MGVGFVKAASEAARKGGILVTAALTAWLTMVIVLLVADMVFAVAGQGGGSAAFVAFVTLPFWLVGLPIVGSFVWVMAHRLVARNAKNAVAIGGLVAALCASAILQGLIPSLDPEALLSKALIGLSAALGGAVAGWVIWELAYSRAIRS